MMKFAIMVPLFVCLASGAVSQATPVRPIVFEPSDQPHEFVASTPEGALRLSRAGLDIASKSGRAVRLSVVGGRNVEPTLSDLLTSVSHYYLGNDPKQWRTGVRNYAKVVYRGVYKGIDLVVYGSNGSFEYDFVVAPGADPRRIRMRFQGGGRLKINHAGDLVAERGGLTEHRPRVFQGQGEIAGAFHLHPHGAVTLDLGSFDHSRPLTIDPVITYLTLIGGRSGDNGISVSVDKAGNSYVAGSTISGNFPGFKGFGQITTGPVTSFVSKFAPFSGGKTELLFTVFLGDNVFFNNQGGLAIARAVTTDASGNIIVAGETSDVAFPTKDAFQSQLAGGEDCLFTDGSARRCEDGFVTKLKPDGTALIFSTYYGGTFDNSFEAAATDSTGNIYAAGYSVGVSIRGTDNAIQPEGTPSRQHMMAVRFDASGKLLYSTYLAGSGDDIANAIAVEKPGVVWIGGDVGSKDLPMPPSGAGFQPTFTGLAVSAYLARIDMNQSGVAGLTYATYFNGQGNTDLTALFLDPSGQVVFCGGTVSTLPTTSTAMQPELIGLPLSEINSRNFTAGDGYIARINPTLAGTAALTYASYVGGSDSDRATGCGVDLKGNFVVTGNTGSLDLFFQAGSPIPRKLVLGGNGTWPFVIKINPKVAGGLVDSLITGGTELDLVNAMAIDNQGYAYITGVTESKDLPVTASAVQKIYGGDDPGLPARAGFGDAFLMRVDLNATQVAALQLILESGDFQFAAPGSALAAPIAVHIADASGNPLSLSGYTIKFTGTQAAVTDSRVLTDGDGIAKTTATISGDATVSATVDISGFPGQPYVFHFKALNGALPKSVAIVSGDKQSGNAGVVLPSPLVVELRDSNNAARALAGLTVQFKPVNARVGSPTAVTDAAGRASTTVTLGPSAGVSSVQVIVGSLAVVTATFTVTGASQSSPVIGPDGVQSAATYKNDSVAPGLIAFIKGSNLGPADLVVNGPGADGKFSTVLGQTRVLFDGVPGAMIYTSSGQLSVIVPYEVAGKAFTNVQVEYLGAASASLQVPVASVQLGLFSADSSGRGPAAILNQDNSINSAANPAQRASIVVLFGTGEGQTDPPGVDGQTAASVYPKPKQPITAKVNGIPAEVPYYGAAPTLVAGVLQVNVKIPEGVPDGDATIQIFEGTGESPATVTVAVKGDQ